MFGFNPQAWDWLLASQVAQQQGNAGLADDLAFSIEYYNGMTYQGLGLYPGTPVEGG